MLGITGGIRISVSLSFFKAIVVPPRIKMTKYIFKNSSCQLGDEMDETKNENIKNERKSIDMLSCRPQELMKPLRK